MINFTYPKSAINNNTTKCLSWTGFPVSTSSKIYIKTITIFILKALEISTIVIILMS